MPGPKLTVADLRVNNAKDAAEALSTLLSRYPLSSARDWSEVIDAFTTLLRYRMAASPENILQLLMVPLTTVEGDGCSLAVLRDHKVDGDTIVSAVLEVVGTNSWHETLGLAKEVRYLLKTVHLWAADGSTSEVIMVALGPQSLIVGGVPIWVKAD